MFVTLVLSETIALLVTFAFVIVDFLPAALNLLILLFLLLAILSHTEVIGRLVT